MPSFRAALAHADDAGALAPWRAPDAAREHVELELLGLAQEMLSRDQRPHPTLSAGEALFAELVVRDLDGAFGLPAHAGGSRTARPALDLGVLYGAGPRRQPYLYTRADARRFALDWTRAGEEDLPRNGDASQGGRFRSDFEQRRTALVADPRSDESILTAQLHLALLRTHNALVDRGASFEEARRALRLHAQHVVLRDLLPKLCSGDAVGAAVERAAIAPVYTPASIDAVAHGALAFVHALVAKHYALSDAMPEPLRLFRELSLASSLEGGRELPPGWAVQWDRFVAWRGSLPQPAMRIDAALARPLKRVPGPHWSDAERHLPYRVLREGVARGLPSGQAVARALGEPARPGDEPLLLYVLREAAEECDGLRLGPVGGRLVAHALVDAIASAEDSLFDAPGFAPSLGRAGEPFAVADLVAFGGSPMTREDWAARPRVTTSGDARGDARTP
ncbi:MAG: peroxidase family protein [Myxococcota bacterium]